jgi:peptide/nickel transport system permease protein
MLISRFLSQKRIKVALGFVTLLIFAVIAAPIITPYSPREQPDIIGLRAQPPMMSHPFGTDLASRDVLSRVIYGGRTSLSVALLSVLLSTTLGVLVGAIAGWVGGWVDSVIMRAIDGILAIPRILLLILLLSFWANGGVFAIIVAIGCTGWFGITRLVRAEVIAAKPREYVSAAVALGANRRRIVFRHILPNVIGPAIVASTVAVAQVIALEAGLSFLGLGPKSGYPSWGSIILDAQGSFGQLWWIPLFPGLAVVATALAFNVIGDGLREAIVGRP